MSGVEIAVAVISITAGIGTCIRLSTALIKRWKAKKERKAEAERLNRLLQDEEEQIKWEFGRLAACRGAGLRVDDARLQRIIQNSEETIAQLKQRLEALAQQPDDDGNVDFATMIDLATQSQELTLEALRQLNSGSASRISILSGVTLVDEDPPQENSSPAQGQLCQAAILYRSGRAEFVDLTTPQSTSAGPSWVCGTCSAELIHTKLLIHPPSSDHIWINGAGFMKAHCVPVGGRQHWRCIWEERSPECREFVPGRRELLKHMLRHHVGKLPDSHRTRIDWPSEMDTRPKSKMPESCGYGAQIRGRVMRSSTSSFYMSGSLQK